MHATKIGACHEMSIMINTVQCNRNPPSEMKEGGENEVRWQRTSSGFGIRRSRCMTLGKLRKHTETPFPALYMVKVPGATPDRFHTENPTVKALCPLPSIPPRVSAPRVPLLLYIPPAHLSSGRLGHSDY